MGVEIFFNNPSISCRFSDWYRCSNDNFFIFLSHSITILISSSLCILQIHKSFCLDAHALTGTMLNTYIHRRVISNANKRYVMWEQNKTNQAGNVHNIQRQTEWVYYQKRHKGSIEKRALRGLAVMLHFRMID